MKIVVTDANIFIEIIELNISREFFELQLEVHTSLDVYNELHESQKNLLNAYRTAKILFIHNITGAEKQLILAENYPEAFSCMDKTALFLAKKFDSMVLSCDHPVREYAKANAIKPHGMLWILDTLLETGSITARQAINLIQELFSKNAVYRYNISLLQEQKKRISKWSVNLGA